MADDRYLYVKGVDEITSFLSQVAPKIQRNVLRGALRAGARLVQKQAQANIHSASGRTAKSIKVGTRTAGTEVTAYVRVKDHKGKWLEYGTRPHVIRPKNRKALVIGGKVVEQVNHPGARPRAFLRPALDGQAYAAVVAAGEYMKERLATKNGLDTSEVQIGEES
jgi:HK97 gp10 family phage protein